jgi:tRNA G18 (ribose-2'-O)-methylase SpoU
LCALSPDPTGTPLPETDLSGRVGLLLGTEGDGLTAAAIARCDLRVRIPMAEGIDSLNVAAASAVAIYALSTAD